MVAAFLILLSYIPSKQSHIKCRKDTDLVSENLMSVDINAGRPPPS